MLKIKVVEGRVEQMYGRVNKRKRNENEFIK
jgi:hypothetical protein